jgi:predicted transcriptional regulator of viral defense system
MRTPRCKERVGELARRQFGRVSRRQLDQLEVPSAQVTRWLADGYLYKVLPGVYAVGHRAPDVEADLMAAVLYAGPGAALSHATAAWWLGLADDRPPLIQVSTPRSCRSVTGIRVYPRREKTRILHKGLPVTTYPQIFLDLAATTDLLTVRRALANADFKKVLDTDGIEQILGRGVRGAKTLRAALRTHLPSLARTKSRLERLLLRICEEEQIELPEINVYVGDGWKVDALWRKARLAVELDGHGNHHTPAQLRRDRRKEMALRKRELIPIRYSEEQLKNERAAVVTELRTLTLP